MSGRGVSRPLILKPEGLKDPWRSFASLRMTPSYEKKLLEGSKKEAI